MSFLDRVATDASKVLLNPRDFAQSVRFTHAGSAARRFSALFYPKYQSSDLMGVDVANGKPVLLCREDDVEDGIARGDEFEIEVNGEDVTFHVLDPQEEEEGWRTVILSRDEAHG